MTAQLNIPTLRFPGFEGEWKFKRLSDFIYFKAGYAFKSEKMSSIKKQYQLIKMSNVYNNELRLDRSPSYWESIDKNSENALLQKGDVVLTLTGTVGKRDFGYSTQINKDNKFLLNQRLVLLRYIEQKSDSNFILETIRGIRFLESFFNEAKGGTGNQANVSIEDLKSLLLPFPTLPEQQKIASFLSKVDEKLTQLKKKKELLEQYKKGMMQKIFSQEIRFKDDNGEEFADWEENKLGDIAEKINAKNKQNDVTAVLTNSAALGIVNQRDFFDKDIANQNNLAGYYIVETNDFVYNPRISNIAPVGPIGRNHLEKGVMSPLYTVFRFKKGVLDFLEKYFKHDMWHEYMESIANYGARHDRMNVSISDFFEMPIPFPSEKEQTKIANFLSSLDQKIAHTQTKIEKAEQWKKGLLQQLFV